MHDVCIIGAGPAGLNAALILGRCRRRVIVFDSGRPRNAASRGLHGFLTRDGVHPLQLRDLGRAEVARYPTVSVRDVEVSAVLHRGGHFEITAADHSSLAARILLLATGRVDLLPAKPGCRELYGRGVYHCPICDGWEHHGEPFVTYGRGRDAAEFALELLVWTDRVALCTDGEAELDGRVRGRLARNRVTVIEKPIASLRAGPGDFLEHIEFADGSRHYCAALFLDVACPQHSSLAQNLGAEIDGSGGIRCNAHAATNVPGLFVAGNVRCGIHLAITAAAEGVEAAVAINQALLQRDLA